MARYLRYAGLGMILATVAAGPYFQGLFFPYQQHAAETAIAAGFLVWALGLYREGRHIPLLAGGVEISVLALLGCYLLASFTAIFPQGHLNVVLQLVAGLLVFYAVRTEQAIWPGLGQWMAWLLVAASVGIVLIGLGPYVGVVPSDQSTLHALSVWGLDKRLTSTFQYWNTYAVYAVAMWMILTGLAMRTRRRAVALPLAGVLGFLYGLTFLLAASRGALLALPVAVVLLAVALPRGQRLAGVLFLAATFAPALAALKGVDGNSALSDWYRVYKWLAAGSVAGALGGGAVAVWLALLRRWQGALAAVAAVAVLAGGGWAVGHYGSFTTAANRVLPPKAQRLLDINWQTVNVVLRVIMDEDATRIVADRPLLGAGGRSWDRLYPQYQEFRYVASEVHNHFLQVAVEAGIPGLLAFLTFLGALAWQGLRRPGGLAQGPVMTAAALTIAAHSVVDFNLSYLSVWLIVAAAAGTAAPALGQARAGRPLWAGLAAALVLIVTAPHAAGGYYLQEGSRLVETGALPAATTLLERATSLMPLDPEPWAELARARAGAAEKADALRRAAALDPNHHEWSARLYVALERQADWPAAYAAARDALRLQPTMGEYYKNALSAGVQVAVKAVLTGDRADARRLVAEVSGLVDQLEDQQRRAKPRENLWRQAYPAYTPAMHLRAGQALALAGRYEVALPHLQEAQKQTALLPEADIWMYLIYERQGALAGQQRLARKPWILSLRVNPLAPVLGQAAEVAG